MKRLIGPGFVLVLGVTMICCAAATDSTQTLPANGGADGGTDASAGNAGAGGASGSAGKAGSGGAAAGASGQAGGAGTAAGASGQAGSETGGAAGSTAGAAGQAGSVAAGAAGTAGAGGASGGAGTAGTAGSGGGPISEWGCADGTREGFADKSQFPLIAACNGAWDQPGIFNMPAMCNRQAGNTGVNQAGTGCTVTDLCAPGWRVCYGRDDVLARNKDGCLGVMNGATSPVFFTTQMSSTGAFQCSTGTTATNDLFGCGDLGCNFSGDPTAQALCAPLIMSSHDLCKGLRNDGGCGDWCNHLGKYPSLGNAWSCGSDTEKEALNVTKTKADQQGGVLCCVDN
ncbi:MAG: hypothetical protein HY898_31710 [Deltaproteobacteria bacterium]|nr:hypothetical protein [Deltaproteobacteria bacterium]